MGDGSRKNEAVQVAHSFIQPYLQEENYVALHCPRCGELGAIDVSDCLKIPKEEVEETDIEIRCPNTACNTPWKLALEILYNLYKLQQRLCSQYSESEEGYPQESPTKIFIVAITPP